MVVLLLMTAASPTLSPLAAAPVLHPSIAPLPAHRMGLARRTMLAHRRPTEVIASSADVRPSNQITALMIVIWYALSVVSNQSSKVLVSAAGAEMLTLFQLIVASVCGALILKAQASPSLFFSSRAQFIDTAQLAGAFLAGCHTLNACFATMHVSIAMTLRAAEPLTTLVLGMLLLPRSEQPPRRRIAALLPVVAGCAMSAMGDNGPTSRSLFLVGISNVCFSLRAILGKRVKTAHGTGPILLFFQMCAIGALFQLTELLGRMAFAPNTIGMCSKALQLLGKRPLMIIFNGICFYSQLQLSFICLSRMSAVSHSVANSMRRPVTIIGALLYTPVKLTVVNWMGMAVACLGALVYGLI